MTTRDKIGAVILVLLFVFLAGAIVLFSPPRPDKTFSPEDSPIVQQRIKNLEKSR